MDTLKGEDHSTNSRGYNVLNHFIQFHCFIRNNMVGKEQDKVLRRLSVQKALICPRSIGTGRHFLAATA